MIRPIVSTGPPAGNGTMIVTGREGKACDSAGFPVSRIAASAAATHNSLPMRSFPVFLIHAFAAQGYRLWLFPLRKSNRVMERPPHPKEGAQRPSRRMGRPRSGLMVRDAPCGAPHHEGQRHTSPY